MCEACDLCVQGRKAIGYDVTELAGAAGAGGRRLFLDEEVQSMGAAADVLQGETQPQEAADDADAGHLGEAVFALAGRGAWRRRKQAACLVQAQSARGGSSGSRCLADPHVRSRPVLSYNSTMDAPKERPAISSGNAPGVRCIPRTGVYGKRMSPARSQSPKRVSHSASTSGWSTPL